MSAEIEALVERLAGRSPTVAVVGLGYVGLPLAVELARSGALVRGIDVSEDRVASVNAGRSHLLDVPSDALAPLVGAAAGAGRIVATADFDALADADAVVLCVPTPLRKSKDPDISHVVQASEQAAARARAGQLIVLESTTYPGTTVDLVAPLLRDRGLEPGRDVALAFSPERVDPGNRRYSLHNTPKVVGGLTPACAEAATALYRRICAEVVRVSSPTAAEMVKLLENTFRSVNIGLVNEFALICRRLGLDVWEIIDAAATKPFGFMPFRPGPGLGGHCIPVDPHYLAWKLRSLNFTARFVELADAVNSAMPQHVVDVVTDALNEGSRAVRGSRVLALGVAYKPDVADVRESPALEVLALLTEKGADVRWHDPYVASLEIAGRRGERVDLTDEELGRADVVLVLTHHGAYDFERVVRQAKLVVDTRNATAGPVAHDATLAARVRRI